MRNKQKRQNRLFVLGLIITAVLVTAVVWYKGWYPDSAGPVYPCGTSIPGRIAFGVPENTDHKKVESIIKKLNGKVVETDSKGPNIEPDFYTISVTAGRAAYTIQYLKAQPGFQDIGQATGSCAM